VGFPINSFMDFRLWLEFDERELLGLATRIFGKCDPEHNGVSCYFKNREIEFHYDPFNDVVHIQFNWQTPPPRESGREEDFITSPEVQSGSMEGVRKFKEFLQELKQRDIGVAYEPADSRRGKLYSRVLRMVGMRKVGNIGLNDIWK